MGKSSLFGRIANVLKDDDGPSNEDTDREFDQAIAEIDLINVDKVEAAAILDPGYQVSGGVWILSLT